MVFPFTAGVECNSTTQAWNCKFQKSPERQLKKGKDKLRNKNIIVKSTGGLYEVETEGKIKVCKPRGIFRKRGLVPYVGDFVELDGNVITEILPRTNEIIRPPLSNLDMLVFVVSSCRPKPNLLMLDRFLAVARYKDIVPVTVFTKLDLEDIDSIIEIYRNTSLVHTVNYEKNDTGIDGLLDLLKGKTSCFTGNSGVGKSTLLNKIIPGLNLPTAEISEKLGRGKHTTRHCQLHKIPVGGYIADTPGFSTFELSRYAAIPKEELAGLFPEFLPYIGKCRFRDCSHTNEKDCAVAQAVENKKIPYSRYRSYCTIREELDNL
jgi:ribosome biogenesis GTPase